MFVGVIRIHERAEREYLRPVTYDCDRSRELRNSRKGYIYYSLLNNCDRLLIDSPPVGHELVTGDTASLFAFIRKMNE